MEDPPRGFSAVPHAIVQGLIGSRRLLDWQPPSPTRRGASARRAMRTLTSADVAVSRLATAGGSGAIRCAMEGDSGEVEGERRRLRLSGVHRAHSVHSPLSPQQRSELRSGVADSSAVALSQSQLVSLVAHLPLTSQSPISLTPHSSCRRPSSHQPDPLPSWRPCHTSSPWNRCLVPFNASSLRLLRVRAPDESGDAERRGRLPHPGPQRLAVLVHGGADARRVHCERRPADALVPHVAVGGGQGGQPEGLPPPLQAVPHHTQRALHVQGQRLLRHAGPPPLLLSPLAIQQPRDSHAASSFSLPHLRCCLPCVRLRVQGGREEIVEGGATGSLHRFAVSAGLPLPSESH